MSGEHHAESSVGLFGGFEGHRVASDERVDHGLVSALVAVDANVLLGLYRYPDEFGAALRSALEEMADRVFVPRQALVEFWRNRTSALEDRARARFEVTQRLTKCERSVTDAIASWAKQTTLDDDDRDYALSLVTRHFEVLSGIIDDAHQDDSETYPSPGLDPIVQALESLLDGRVGPKMPDPDYASAVQEGQRRHQCQEPPGFKEKVAEKSHLPETVAGDYLVWTQAVAEAERRQLDLLIITDDEKEDWYWRSREAIIGPRPELAKEFWDRTGGQLFLMTALQFMRRFRAVGGDVSEGALIEAQRQVDPDHDQRPTASSGEGWTAEAVRKLLQVLDAEAPVQANVIRTAAAQGGSVDRAEIYRIGNYDRRRMLRGFTRPVRRVSRMLQESGELDLEAPEMLRPRYDHGVQANAFEIPPEVTAIIGG